MAESRGGNKIMVGDRHRLSRYSHITTAGAMPTLVLNFNSYQQLLNLVEQLRTIDTFKIKDGIAQTILKFKVVDKAMPTSDLSLYFSATSA